jgi:3-oxoadipate enol-lactonase
VAISIRSAHYGQIPDPAACTAQAGTAQAGTAQTGTAQAGTAPARAPRHDAVPRIATRRIQLRDHQTELASLGDGRLVVLVHALGLTWRMWAPVMPALAAGRRLVAYDVRGHGAATRAPRPRDMSALAEDLHEVIHRAGADRAHVVGLSYGGAIAQTLAVRHPEAVESLTLAATTDRPFPAFGDRAAAVDRDGPAAQVASSLTRWFTPAALAENGWGVRYARDCVRTGDAAQVASAWRALSTLDVRGRLAGLGRPVLVLAGQCDASTPPEMMRRITAEIPGSHYRELPGAPHMPTLETPQLVVDALDDFLPRGG